MHNDIRELYCKMGMPRSAKPSLPPPEIYELREKLLDEELLEFKEAIACGNLAEAADALVDLVVVAMGTAEMMGLPWAELWAEVHRANMSKVKASCSSESKRNSGYDMVKPVGWVPPDIAGVLKRHE